MPDLLLIQSEIDRLADELLASARRDAHGLYWLTPPDPAREHEPWQVDESLFGGTTGIVLFFAALARYSGRPAHREAAEAGTRWLVAHARAHPAGHLSFFSGRLGIVYLCCKLYELTSDSWYVRQARQLAQAMRPRLLAGNASPDLLGGEAGHLFVITYLYHLTGAAGWLPVLEAGLARLVQRALPARQGLKWGYRPNSLDGLTGLSHGASGIACVLLELGRYFGRPALYWLADQALRYEAQYYRKALGNWLDLRVYAECATNAATLHQPPAALLINGGNSPGWAYGTAGFGLVRLRAWEINPLARYREEARAALAKTRRDLARQTSPVVYTLSAGRGGQAELLLVAAGPLADATLVAQARQVALAALRQRQRHGHYLTPSGQPLTDPSLLTGRAGIGYFLLRALAPNQVDAILLPRLPPARVGAGSHMGIFGMGQSATLIRRQVWGAHFPRTLCLLAQVAPLAMPALFSEVDSPSEARELMAVQRQLQQAVRTLPPPAKRVVAEALRLETLRLALLTRREGIVYRVARQHALPAQAQAWATLTPALFQLCSFRLGAHVRLLPARWSWSATTPEGWLKNVAAAAGHYPLLLVSEADAVHEFALGAFPAALLRVLRRPATGASLVAQLRGQLAGGTEPAALSTLLAAIMGQLKQLVAEGIVELPGPVG